MPDSTDKTNIEQLSTFYRKLVQSIPGVIILDRFYPSSIVYGEHFKRELDLSDLDLLHKTRDVFVFIIDRDEPFRGDHFIDTENWKQIRKLYLENANKYQWKVIKNDTTLENCVKEIIGNLQF